jgi:hypothetical protein
MVKGGIQDLDTFEIMKIPLLIFVLIIAVLASCRKDDMKMQNLDLTSYGIPLTIIAPDSAEVQEKPYPFMRDITIRKDNRYYVQIFEFEAPKLDAAGEKLRQLASVKEDPYFIEVVMEDEQGFIYSRTLDSTKLNYDFRYIKILGPKELIFQTGLVGTFTLEDVKRMYKSVKSE